MVTRLDLNGTWLLLDSEGRKICEACVPGSVLDALFKAGIIPHPYDRLNEKEMAELFQKDYILERKFDVPETFFRLQNFCLTLYGVDTLADISVNGNKILETANMHRTYRVPLSGMLRPHENTISVRLKSVLRYIREFESAPGKEVHYAPVGARYGGHLVRKAHSMFGWDWGPQVVDAGIWRPVFLEAGSVSYLRDIRIRQEQTRDGSVRVTAEPLFDGRYEGKTAVHVYDPDGRQITREEVFCGEVFEAVIEKPQLWWPAGTGEHPLYRIEAETPDGQRVEKRIGLRTMTVSREKDEWGSEFAFCVNGRKIFARGGDYIPEDAVYPWITGSTIEYILKSCVRANFNCIRVWGGGYYPSDEFYDLCDRFGLIVWQDFMFACHVYDVTGELEENIAAEIRDNVRRIRHHACLGLWCGNNEIESAWDHWDDFKKESSYLRADYIKLFEHTIPAIVREEDPDTFFWPSSPSSGGCFDDPDDENRGDTHYWDVWHGQKPFQDYQNHYFRFCSEFGFQSFPCMKTIESFTEEEDRNIFSEVMENHQKNPSANGKILYYLSENFRYPKDLRSIVYISQVLQAMAIRSGVEHFRRNRGRCMGAVYWQINDNWPVASWSGIDYYGRWKALHYAARHFFAPIAASIQKKEGEYSLYLVNDTNETRETEAVLRIRDIDFRVIREWKSRSAVPSDEAKKLLKITVSEETFDFRRCFIEAVVTCPGAGSYVSVETLVPYKYMELKKPVFQTEITETAEAFEIQLTSSTFAPFVEIDFSDADCILSDNFFTIASGDPVAVVLKKEDIIRGNIANADDLRAQMRINTVADTW